MLSQVLQGALAPVVPPPPKPKAPPRYKPRADVPKAPNRAAVEEAPKANFGLERLVQPTLATHSNLTALKIFSSLSAQGHRPHCAWLRKQIKKYVYVPAERDTGTGRRPCGSTGSWADRAVMENCIFLVHLVRSESGLDVLGPR